MRRQDQRWCRLPRASCCAWMPIRTAAPCEACCGQQGFGASSKAHLQLAEGMSGIRPHTKKRRVTPSLCDIMLGCLWVTGRMDSRLANAGAGHRETPAQSSFLSWPINQAG